MAPASHFERASGNDDSSSVLPKRGVLLGSKSTVQEREHDASLMENAELRVD